MATALKEKVTLLDVRAACQSGRKLPMLTCYDYTTARLMQEAGVPSLLVGDSAASVILGHPTTLPAPLPFMIEITAAVRRGAPLVFLVADMPFGSYQESTAQGVHNICEMVKQTGCDCVKIEAGQQQIELVKVLADAGVATMPHLGLRPQTIGMLGGYKYQGRTAESARQIVELAVKMEQAGAAALLLEAVPPEVSAAVVEATGLPVIGCGAGGACHGYVFVTQDGLGLSGTRPKFVPVLAEMSGVMREAFARYIEQVTSGTYPAAQHNYTMPAGEAARLGAWMKERRNA